MKQTEKLQLSNYLVKQALMGKILASARGLGAGLHGSLAHLVSNPRSLFSNSAEHTKGVNDLVTGSLTKLKGKPGFDPANAKFLDRGAEFGKVLGGGVIPGVTIAGAPIALASKAKASGRREAEQAYQAQQQAHRQQQSSKGYMGRLLDAITNQGY